MAGLDPAISLIHHPQRARGGELFRVFALGVAALHNERQLVLKKWHAHASRDEAGGAGKLMGEGKPRDFGLSLAQELVARPRLDIKIGVELS